MPDPPYKFIADGLKEGSIIPFFGAAASAIYRPQDEHWVPGKGFMPFGSELAASLATAASYPSTATDAAFDALFSDLKDAVNHIADSAPNFPIADVIGAIEPIVRKHVSGPPSLALIASWAEHVQGNRRAVNRELRQAFICDCPPGSLQAELAAIEGTKLFVTTNYDSLLEKALAPRRPHLIVDRCEKGLWVSVAGGTFQEAKGTGKELYDLLDDPGTQQPSQPILYKMHGSIDRDPRNDSFLVTEEDYVDFLGRANSYVPPYVNALMKGKDMLFLGYSLEDWNVRVILRKLMRHVSPESGNIRFWAIVRGRSDAEEEVWKSNNLNVYPIDLNTFIMELKKYL
jgi:SIR2-like domain